MERVLTREYVKQAALPHCACLFEKVPVSHSAVAVLSFLSARYWILETRKLLSVGFALFVHRDTPKCFECSVALQFWAAVEVAEVQSEGDVCISKIGRCFSTSKAQRMSAPCLVPYGQRKNSFAVSADDDDRVTIQNI